MSDAPGTAPTNAIAAANEFVRFGLEERNVPPVDQMKLQKLLFYSHAWHLAMRGTPLFDEDFEAWPWGPVVRDVYVQTRRFGRGAVTTELERLEFKNGTYEVRIPDAPPAETIQFLRSVWDGHKTFSGVQLSNSTHAPGEPWTIVKDELGVEDKPTISNDLIQQVFRGKLVGAATS